MADTYTVKAGDKYNPYTGKKLSSSQQKAGTVISAPSTSTSTKSTSSGSSGSTSSGSTSTKTTSTSTPTTYTVKAGDNFNPFTGAPLTSAQKVAGTVLTSGGTTAPTSSGSTSSSSGGGTSTTQTSYTVKAGDAYNPFTGAPLTTAEKTPGTVISSSGTITAPTPTPTPTTTNTTTSPTTYTVKAGDAYNPFTGAPLSTAEKTPGTVLSKTPTAPQEIQTTLPSSFSERLSLAQEAGITNYTGTAAQNAKIEAYQAQQQMIQAQGETTPTEANTGQNGAVMTPAFIGQTLQQGSTGADVSKLQSMLSSYGLTVDGVFGPKTLAAVKSFQASKGLVADGIVGPKTWAALSGTTVNPLASIGAGLSSPMTGQIDELTGEPIDTTGLVPNPSGDPLIDTINNLLQQYKNSSPQVQWSEVLKQVYSDMGYNNIKNEYDTYNQEYAKLEEKKNNEAQDINNNPWYTEGERVKRLQQLDNKYEGKELILQNKMKLAETQIDNLRSDAQYITSQTMAQVNANAHLQQDVILKAIDIAEAQMAAESKLSGLTGPSSVQEYQYAVQQGYTGSFTQYQNEDANRKISIAKAGVSGSGLTPAQINSTVNSIAGAFDNEAVVKDYNTIKRQVEVFNSLGNSAVDDIQRVYAFAKIADPTSAVKEGEYNSIEKYSQALLQRSGLKVSRVFSATGILTPEARKAMSATIQKSLDVAENSYNQVYNEYQRQIADTYAGNPRSITQYTAPMTSGNPVSNVENSLTFEGKTAYLPRSVWSTLGADMDELLADMKQQGYTLLITD